VKAVDGVNKNRFPFQGRIRPVRVAYTWCRNHKILR
jgi:hypothetical protein